MGAEQTHGVRVHGTQQNLGDRIRHRSKLDGAFDEPLGFRKGGVKTDAGSSGLDTPTPPVVPPETPGQADFENRVKKIIDKLDFIPTLPGDLTEFARQNLIEKTSNLERRNNIVGDILIQPEDDALLIIDADKLPEHAFSDLIRRITTYSNLGYNAARITENKHTYLAVDFLTTLEAVEVMGLSVSGTLPSQEYLSQPLSDLSTDIDTAGYVAGSDRTGTQKDLKTRIYEIRNQTETGDKRKILLTQDFDIPIFTSEGESISRVRRFSIETSQSLETGFNAAIQNEIRNIANPTQLPAIIAAVKEGRNTDEVQDNLNKGRVEDIIVALREAIAQNQPIRELEIRLGRLFNLPPEADTDKAYEAHWKAQVVSKEIENIITAFATAPTDVPFGHFLLQIPEIHRPRFKDLILKARTLKYSEQNSNSPADTERHRQEYKQALSLVDIAIRTELNINLLPATETIRSDTSIDFLINACTVLWDAASSHSSDEIKQMTIDSIKHSLTSRNRHILEEYPKHTESLQAEVDYLKQKLQAAGFKVHVNPETGEYQITPIPQDPIPAAPAAQESVQETEAAPPVGEQTPPEIQPTTEDKETPAQKRARIIAQRKPLAQTLIELAEEPEVD